MHVVEKAKKAIQCKMKNQLKTCYKNQLLQIYEILNNLEKYEAQIENKLDTLMNRLLKQFSLDEVLSINRKELTFDNQVCQGLYSSFMQQSTSLNDCEYDPSHCENSFDLKESEMREKKQDIRMLIHQYNQYIDVLNDIHSYTTEYKTSNESTIIRFGFDKENNLICLFCDISKAISNAGSFDLYVFNGDYHTQREKLYMYLNYGDNEGKVVIIDFFTHVTRQGHGTFALNNLESILIELNKLITKANEKRDYPEIVPPKELISYVTGTIKPHKRYISLENLKIFYDICGYLDENECLYREISIDSSNQL